MNRLLLFIDFFFLFTFCIYLPGKAQDSTILVKGQVIQHPPIGFSDLLIVNMTTGRGVFGNPDGTFVIQINRQDEIKISCRGYKTVAVNFRDSIPKPEYDIIVEVYLLEIRFDKPIIVRPQRTLDELEEAKARIGSHRYDPIVRSGLAGIMNPVSMLYQMFSKAEAEKRKYVELLNQKELDDALKDITRYLIYSGLFDIPDDDLEIFIGSCKLNPDFVRQSSMYEVSLALLQCYERFKKRY